MKLRTHLNHSNAEWQTHTHVKRTPVKTREKPNKMNVTHTQRSTKAGSSKQITLKFQQFAINWDNKAQKANQSAPQMYSNFLPPSQTIAHTHRLRIRHVGRIFYMPHFAWHFGEFRVQSHSHSHTYSHSFRWWKSHFNNCKTTNLLQLETVMVTVRGRWTLVLPARTGTLFMPDDRTIVVNWGRSRPHWK